MYYTLEQLEKKLYDLKLEFEEVYPYQFYSYEWKPEVVKHYENGVMAGIYTCEKDGHKYIGKLRNDEYNGILIEMAINKDGKKYEG